MLQLWGEIPSGAIWQRTKKRTVVICASCDKEVWLTASNLGFSGIGYICSECTNYVALCYGKAVIQPKQVLDASWNPTMGRRLIPIDSQLSLIRCESVKDYLVLQTLQAVVKEEGEGFLFSRRGEEHIATLLLDSEAKKYLGFIVWTENDCAVLRQLFIVPAERKKGYAEKMVAFWIKQFADPLNEKFAIESPNDRALSLHLKMGHIKKNENGGYTGLKSASLAVSKLVAGHL